MAIYTGVADANGDFTVPFSSNYTGGQKITVTAEKDSELKTIELYAPSEVTGGGVIQFSGTLEQFPSNIGVITFIGIEGVIQPYAFAANSNNFNMFKVATGLVLPMGITEIAEAAFYNWKNCESVSIPSSVQRFGALAFYNNLKLTQFECGDGVLSIGEGCWMDCLLLQEFVIHTTTPPTAGNNMFAGTHSSLVIKVPAAAVAAYQAAPQWSAYASRIQAI